MEVASGVSADFDTELSWQDRSVSHALTLALTAKSAVLLLLASNQVDSVYWQAAKALHPLCLSELSPVTCRAFLRGHRQGCALLDGISMTKDVGRRSHWLPTLYCVMLCMITSCAVMVCTASRVRYCKVGAVFTAAYCQCLSALAAQLMEAALCLFIALCQVCQIVQTPLLSHALGEADGV